ncbi:S8 family serine peptidase [Brevibacillus brevis]|uniref:S8 family serine peptidase n=1 Tax=Brevibacillus brevis TaxID=1393 RepID=UPI00165E2517|nr:S8 family serine peptidase [Brevibacillus brevis]
MSKLHIITFKDKDHGRNKQKLNKQVEKNTMMLVGKGLVKQPKIHAELKQFPQVFIIEDANDEMLNDLRNDPNVLDVEEDFVYKAHMGQTVSWTHVAPAGSHITEFHKRGYTGAGVKIGYLDSGAANHEDLVYAGRYNAYSNTIPPEADPSGHGTAVAGVIAGRNNSLGYVGVAPDAQLYGVKVDDNSGDGLMRHSAIIKGLEWLVSQKVKIISCSYGSEKESSSARAAYQNAYNSGVLIFASAGNEANNVSDYNPVNNPNNVHYPAGYDFVVAVGNIDKTGAIVHASSRGSYVDVSAPGEDVMTTHRSIANKNGEYLSISTEYGTFGGTSSACPHVAGMAALYWQMNPTFTAAQIRNLIEANVQEMGAEGKDITYGLGKVVSPWVTKGYRYNFTGTSVSNTLTAGMPDTYKFIPTESGLHRFTVASPNSLLFSLYTSDGGLANGSWGGDYLVEMELTAGRAYYLEVATFSIQEAASYTLNVNRPANGELVSVIADFELFVGFAPFEFTGNWGTSGSTGYNGSDGIRSAPISHGEKTDMAFNVTVPAGAIDGKLSFWYQMNTESSDKFIVLDNGSTKLTVGGTQTNKTFEMPLSAGTHTITLRYQKDGSTSSGTDCVYVDNINLTYTNGTGGGNTPGDSFTNPIVVSGTSANGTLKDTKDLFFRYTIPNTGSYTFTTAASFDSYMQLLDSSQNILAQDDDGAGSSQPKIIYSLSAGQVVYLKVYGYNHGAGKYGPITLNITPASSGSAPGTPNLTVSSPTTSSLTLNYFASGATTYDIYRNGVRIVAGTTQTSYQDTGLSANTTYSYFVIGINSYGTTTSTSVYGTTLSSSGGGVTPTTILEDFEDANMNFNFSGDWTRVTRGYQSTYAFISTVPAVGASSSTQFTVSVPAGATTAQLKFNARCDSSKSTTPLCDLQVFVNGSLKLTLPANATTWYVDQVVALGTGDQTIKFQWNRNNNNTSFLRQAIIDSVEVKWS